MVGVLLYGQAVQDEPQEIKMLRNIAVSVNPDNESGLKLRDFVSKMLRIYPKMSGCIKRRIENYLQKRPEAIEPQFAYEFKFNFNP